MNELVQENIVDYDGEMSYDDWLSQNRPILSVASLAAAFECVEIFADDGCIDNHRWYNMETDENIEDYQTRFDEGCCGFFDMIFSINNQKHMVGINYGH